MAAAVLVLLLAVAFRVHIDRPLTTDEASYALAAERGIFVNWADVDGARKLRHEHPPLVVYAQRVSMALLGRTEEAVRLPSVVAGVLTVAVLLFAYRRTVPELPGWTVIPAATLLAAFPPHVYASQWGSWHAALGLVFAATALIMVRAFRTLETGAFLAVWLGVAVGFAVMEYTLVLLAAVVLLLLIRRTPWLGVAGRRVWLSRGLRTGLLLIPVVVTVTWAAGILKLSLLRNLAHYLGYRDHPVLFRGSTTTDAPPVAYVDWYLEQMPAYLALFAVIAAAVAGLLAARRWSVRHAAFPLVTLFALLLGGLLVQLVLDTVYTVYFGIAAMLLVPFLLAEAAAAIGRRAAVALGVVAMLGVALPTTPYAVQAAQPGSTGYREAAAALQRAASARNGERPRVLAVHSRVIEWYAPGLRVERYPFGGLAPETAEDLYEGRYDWVLMNSGHVHRWPRDPTLRWLEDHAELVAHETDRWGEVWLWRVPDPGPAGVAERADTTRPMAGEP